MEMYTMSVYLGGKPYTSCPSCNTYVPMVSLNPNQGEYKAQTQAAVPEVASIQVQANSRQDETVTVQAGSQSQCC